MGNSRAIILDFETTGLTNTIKPGTRTDRAPSTKEKGRNVREKL